MGPPLSPASTTRKAHPLCPGAETGFGPQEYQQLLHMLETYGEVPMMGRFSLGYWKSNGAASFTPVRGRGVMGGRDCFIWKVMSQGVEHILREPIMYCHQVRGGGGSIRRTYKRCGVAYVDGAAKKGKTNKNVKV